MPIGIPDGATWLGSATGREWTSHGADMERSDFLWDGFAWKLEYANKTSTNHVWGSWVDYTDRLLSFNFRRQVASWYRGPRAANGLFTIDDIDGDHGGDVAGKLRLTVTVPSGDYVLCEFLIMSSIHINTGSKYPVIRMTVTDWFGYEGELRVNISDWEKNAATLLIDFLGSSGGATTGITTGQGASMFYPLSANLFKNRNDVLSELVRGDLGMLWVDREGVWQYRSGYTSDGWWDTEPDEAVAAIGSAAGTPTHDYRFRFPLATVSHQMNLSEIKNNLEWITQAAASPHTDTGANSKNSYGERFYIDTLRNKTDAQVATLIQRLGNHLGHDYNIATQSITFPADLSVDAMEYAAIAELTDFLNIAVESLEGLWQEWEMVHVDGVGHSWSPTQGWVTTLSTFSNLAAGYNQGGS